MKKLLTLSLLICTVVSPAGARRRASASVIYQLGAPTTASPNFHGYAVIRQIPLDAHDTQAFLGKFVPQLRLKGEPPPGFKPDYGFSMVYGRVTANSRSHTDFLLGQTGTEGFEDNGHGIYGPLNSTCRGALLKLADR